MTKEIQTENVIPVKSHKKTKFVLGLIFDIIGMLSYLVPGFAETIDIVWAPISGLLISKMYKGSVGKAAGVFSFLEEIIPGTDIIPTFTLTWIYVYVIKKEE
jgi:hypothetical protein